MLACYLSPVAHVRLPTSLLPANVRLPSSSAVVPQPNLDRYTPETPTKEGSSSTITTPAKAGSQAKSAAATQQHQRYKELVSCHGHTTALEARLVEMLHQKIGRKAVRLTLISSSYRLLDYGPARPCYCCSAKTTRPDSSLILSQAFTTSKVRRRSCLEQRIVDPTSSRAETVVILRYRCHWHQSGISRRIR